MDNFNIYSLRIMDNDNLNESMVLFLNMKTFMRNCKNACVMSNMHFTKIKMNSQHQIKNDMFYVDTLV